MLFKRRLRFLGLALALAAVPCFASTPAPARAPIFPSAFEDPEDVPLPDPDLWHRIRIGFLMEPME